MLPVEQKDERKIFVIMPFTHTLTRNATQLTSFFDVNIKSPIENEDFRYIYKVNRSDKTFNINEQIIKDLYYADIVICDLSGAEGNPNVMYELGIRLALSNKPIILIREEHKDNKNIFDISGFYAHPYDPMNYHPLTQHLIQEIRDFEEKKKDYESPILALVNYEEIKTTRKIKELADNDDLIVAKSVSIDEGSSLAEQTISVQRANQLLKSMMASIKILTWRLMKQFAKYLSEKGVKVREQEFDLKGFLEFFENNLEEIGKVDWASFKVNLGSQPTLDFYLSNQYLYKLIDSDIEDIFTGFLITYHSYFFSANYYPSKWDAFNMHRFLGETNILLQCLRILRLFLFEQNPSTQKELLNFIRVALKSSHIYSFDDSSVNL